MPEPVDVVRLREGQESIEAYNAHQWHEGMARHLARLEAKLDAQETLLRQLIVALRGGAVGKWG